MFVKSAGGEEKALGSLGAVPRALFEAPSASFCNGPRPFGAL